MKVDLQSAITRLGENQYGVSVTAVVSTAQAAMELRKWIEGAIATAAGRKNIKPGNIVLLPDNFGR